MSHAGQSEIVVFDVFRVSRSRCLLENVFGLEFDILQMSCSPIREFVCFCAVLSHKEFNETFDWGKMCSKVALCSSVFDVKCIKHSLRRDWGLFWIVSFFSASYKWIWDAWCSIIPSHCCQGSNCWDVLNPFSWAANQQIRMISEGSCDMKTGVNTALITAINDILKYWNRKQFF